MLRVDECRLTAHFLRFRDDVEGDGGLTGGFRPVDLDDASARHAADTERDVEVQRPCRNGADFHVCVFAEAHDGAFAEVVFNTRDSRFQSGFFIAYRDVRIFGVLGGFGGFLCWHGEPPVFSLCRKLVCGDQSAISVAPTGRTESIITAPVPKMLSITVR